MGQSLKEQIWSYTLGVCTASPISHNCTRCEIINRRALGKLMSPKKEKIDTAARAENLCYEVLIANYEPSAQAL